MLVNLCKFTQIKRNSDDYRITIVINVYLYYRNFITRSHSIECDLFFTYIWEVNRYVLYSIEQ